MTKDKGYRLSKAEVNHLEERGAADLNQHIGKIRSIVAAFCNDVLGVVNTTNIDLVYGFLKDVFLGNVDYQSLLSRELKDPLVQMFCAAHLFALRDYRRMNGASPLTDAEEKLQTQNEQAALIYILKSYRQDNPEVARMRDEILPDVHGIADKIFHTNVGELAYDLGMSLTTFNGPNLGSTTFVSDGLRASLMQEEMSRALSGDVSKEDRKFLCAEALLYIRGREDVAARLKFHQAGYQKEFARVEMAAITLLAENRSNSTATEVFDRLKENVDMVVHSTANQLLKDEIAKLESNRQLLEDIKRGQEMGSI